MGSLALSCDKGDQDTLICVADILCAETPTGVEGTNVEKDERTGELWVVEARMKHTVVNCEYERRL